MEVASQAPILRVIIPFSTSAVTQSLLSASFDRSLASTGTIRSVTPSRNSRHYLRPNMSNGKFAFTKALKELRFHFCQTSSESNATRSFLMRAYPTMKKHNPYTPILIREAQQVEPKVWARYEYGKEKMVPLNGLSDKEIEDRVSTLVKES